MKKKNIIDNLIIILFLLLIFQSPLSKNCTGSLKKIFNNLDEYISILFFIISLLKMKFSKIQIKLLLLQLSILIIGFIGTIINNYQPINIVIQDIISCSKFTLVTVGIMSLYRNKDYLNLFTKIKKSVIFIIYFFAIITLISSFHKLPFIFYDNKRFGVYSLQLMFYHPALLAQILVLFLAILGFDKDNNSNYKAIILCLIMLILTLRTKAIVFSLMYILFFNYKKIMNSKFIKTFTIVFLVVCITILTKDSLQTYYGSPEKSARAKMTFESIKIANENVPLGIGFGTYGTAAAIKKYSPKYEELGFRTVYGLGYINTNYATDTFWPAILGEFGYLGLTIFLIYIIRLIKYSFKMIKKRNKFAILYTTLLSYLIICSTSGTSFFNPISVVYGIFIGLSLNYFNKSKCENKNLI